MLLEQRNPSISWEPIAFDLSGQSVAWVWFRPGPVPNGLMFSIPAALFVNVAIAPRLSIRFLVAASGLDPAHIMGWSFGGASFDAAMGTSPLLDQVLSAPPGGANLDITVWMVPMQQPAWPMPHAAGVSPVNPGYAQGMYAPSGSGEDSQYLDALDSCWNSCQALETRVSSLRKDLGSSINRLSSLNRDLSSDERLTCDSRDVQEWADARRWLRDCISVMSRSVKEIDVGTTSGAGKRNLYMDLYTNHIEPRIPFPGMAQVCNELETYRKILQSVIASAQASLLKGSRDGEARANSILNRIGAKMRARRR